MLAHTTVLNMVCICRPRTQIVIVALVRLLPIVRFHMNTLHNGYLALCRIAFVKTVRAAFIVQHPTTNPVVMTHPERVVIGFGSVKAAARLHLTV